MKRSIAGRVYNTATAQYICDLPCHVDRGNFSWHDTALYVTKSGNYFLSGEGGPSSMWAQPHGSNGRIGGSGIRPITQEDALAWAESANLDPDELREAGFTLQDA